MPPVIRAVIRALVGCLLAVGLVFTTATTASAAAIEDYSGYQPQKRCSPKAKPGTKQLAEWLVARGGGAGPISRSCKVGGDSEHKEGRAFDWTLDATVKKDRRTAREFLELAFATDGKDNGHAKARRMGIMYIIWNDHMYAAWDQFEKEEYLSSSCKKVSRCSKTLRHRDHMHISLSRPGGRGDTSWYDRRVEG